MLPQSPYLHLVENLWHILEMKVRKKKISKKLEHKQILREEWLEISSKSFRKRSNADYKL